MRYHYLGGGMAFFERFMEPDVTRNLVTNDFERLDRFVRVIDHRWHDNDAVAMRDRFTYGHDRAGNRTFRDNELDADHGELYAYDALHRLVDVQRGELNGTQDAIVTNELAFQQNWGLSMLGNWQSFDEDDDGDATWDLEQTRTHSEANEIDDIDETTGPSWATPGHDDNGNMTSVPQPGDLTTTYTATYDAWNRLVKLEDDDTSNTVAAYEYDGLNRRIVKKVYASGSLDETRHVYYSQRWQVLEVRVDGTADTDVQVQYLWGQRYVDDLLARDRDATGNGTLDERLYALQDANFNVTAILDDTGSVVERYRYTPYGERTVLDDDWTDDADGLSDYGFAIGHQGLMHDAESGLVYNRRRMLHPMLGRFVQRDPLGYVDGMSVYAYLQSNPFNLVDPEGLNSNEDDILELIERLEEVKEKYDHAVEIVDGIESAIDHLRALAGDEEASEKLAGEYLDWANGKMSEALKNAGGAGGAAATLHIRVVVAQVKAGAIAYAAGEHIVSRRGGCIQCCAEGDGYDDGDQWESDFEAVKTFWFGWFVFHRDVYNVPCKKDESGNIYMLTWAWDPVGDRWIQEWIPCEEGGV